MATGSISTAIAATEVLMSSYDSVISVTAVSVTVTEIGTVITNNRKGGYLKTTAASESVSIPLEVGLNTVTFKAANKLPIVMQFHRT
jgi:hypothetical protein